jgi:tetratricopeptide (TPR) repeat protein
MEENPALRKAVDLTIKAWELHAAQRQQAALQAIDEAIATAEAADLPAFHYRIARENIRLGPSLDQSSLVPILEEAVSYHRREGNVLEQVDALINLAAIHHRQQARAQALNNLDQADAAIEGLSTAQRKALDARAPHGTFRPSTLLRLRLGEIARLRALFTDI